MRCYKWLQVSTVMHSTHFQISLLIAAYSNRKKIFDRYYLHVCGVVDLKREELFQGVVCSIDKIVEKLKPKVQN